MAQSGTEFNAIRISLASPEQIRAWSYGEVTKPETINYRTLRPERDGLFCERIFGPTKDWECACGKYKKIRFKGIKCERCGVEVTRAKVRRERMGNIELAAPVAHIWFSKGIPSRLGLLLDLSPRNLERVLYFAQYIIIEVDTAGRNLSIQELEEQLEQGLQLLEERHQEKIRQMREQAGNDKAEALAPFAEQDAALAERDADISAREAALTEQEAALPEASDDSEAAAALRAELAEQRVALEAEREAIDAEIAALASQKAKATETVDLWLSEQEAILDKTHFDQREMLDDETQSQLDDLNELQPMKLLLEARQRELSDKYSHLFKSGMGAEAILAILKNINLDQERETLTNEMRSTSGQRRKKAVKRLRLVEAFRKSGNHPEWMVLTALPVLPPDLRPMVQLDGGRFATSDLNDLYRRVINRNNRLKRLLELEAPEIIIRNEKRMLQEAVDALIDNGRRGRAISGSHNHRLKSLSDLLRGKQGRFRQNLLGKRVDYSGRSVIVVGPTLQLYQCGLPKRMALELFKPFVMHRLVVEGLAHNIKSAKRAVERVRPEVWDVLEEVIKDRPVLMNRAPTLHRLGIQAFMPVLIEGSAPQLHPLVCTAFNADFDGDQMAIHVPLSRRAVQEARRVMLSIYNMLSPASGEPVVAPTLDIVLGCYYLTMENANVAGAGKRFSSGEEALMAHQMDLVNIQAPVQILQASNGHGTSWLETTVGRLIFRDLLPDSIAEDPVNWNKVMDKGALKGLVSDAYRLLGNEETADMLDNIKNAGFHYATVSGITIGISDLEVPEQKSEVLATAEGQIQQLEEQFQMGLITERERYDQTIRIWTDASDKVTHLIEEALPSYGGVYLMAVSGAKGNISQIKQMAGMRGLMSDPKGFLIPLPVKSSFREGLSVLEYFISTHGARKGLADTALRTADSGYLTRRMIDVAQDVIVLSEDCETMSGIWVRHDYEKERSNSIASFAERLVGRVVCSPIADPNTGEVLADRDAILSAEMAKDLWEAGVTEAYVRSPLACEAARGICRMCYGVMPATGKLVNLGDAAGIIAAQSIGEPGTQLTMRTFHTGGIAGVDITSGIPRVEELFEARVPKNHAILSQIDGTAEVIDSPEGKHIRIVSTEEYREEYPVEESYTVVVQTGDVVESGAQLAQPNGDGNAAEGEEILPVVARMPGTVSVSDGKVTVAWEEQEERTYLAPLTAHVVVRTGDPVKAGQELTAGQKNPHDILLIQGRDAVHDYIIEEVQKVYRFQGVSMHDKHIEIVIRQMMRKVRVDHQGDTELLPGEPVDRAIFDEANRRVLAEGGEPARATPMLLGITRASLGTESFLAAASFQETTRVLTEAAISGSVDHLTGLKENVIIGRLIPARMDLTEEGRERLGIVAEEEEARALAARMALDDVQHEIELEEFTALMAMDPVDAAFHDD